MIIRFTQKDREEIDALTKPLIEEESRLKEQLLSLPDKHFTIEDGVEKPVSKEAIDLTIKINECTKKLWDTTRKKYQSIEDRYFDNLGTSQQAIINDAYNQTKTILNYLLIAVELGKPNVENSIEIRKKIEPIESIVFGTSLMDFIRRSGGDATKLNALFITHLIHRELDRHYAILDEENRKKLLEYVEKAVTDTISKHPEIENSNYWIVTKDSIFQTILPLAVQRRKPQTRKGRSYFRIGTVKYSFDEHSYRDLIKHLGVNAVRLYWMINHRFTQTPNDENKVSFSTIPFFELCGKGDAVKNPKTFSTEIERFRYGDLRSLLSIVVSLDKKDKEGLPELYDQTLFESTFINKERITVTLTQKYADYLRSVGTKGYIPQELLLGDGRQTNAFAIKSKLWDNATQYNNLLSGQGKIISVKSLLKETSLPTIDDLGTYKSRWRDRIRNKFEAALNEAFASSMFTEWRYCKTKSQPLTPQEKRDADRDYYSWEELFISYDIKDQTFKTTLIESAEKNKEKRKEASEKRRRKEVIETAKALEKLEKN